MTWNECFTRYIHKRFGTNPQKEAAKALDKPPSSISNWVNGTLPREDERKKIARWSKGEVPWELHVARARSSQPPRQTGTDG